MEIANSLIVMLNALKFPFDRFIVFPLLLVSINNCNLGRNPPNSRETVPVSQNPPDKGVIEPDNPESDELSHEPEVCRNDEINRELDNRQAMGCYEVALESAQRELDFTFNLISSLNESRVSESAISRLAIEQEAWKEYSEQNCQRQLTVDEEGNAVDSGSSTQYLFCLTAATEKRTKELIEQVGIITPNNSKPSSDAETIRVQELTEGDHFFISDLSPDPGDTAILQVRKQGSTLIGFIGVIGSDANCFRQEVISDTSVETTLNNPMAEPSEPAFSTDTDDGSLGSYYRISIEQYESISGDRDADSTFQACAETFSEEQ